MKKVILSLVVVAALSTASCKKNYTCTCTLTQGGITTTSTSTIDNTKSKATTACNDLSTTATAAGFTGSCSL